MDLIKNYENAVNAIIDEFKKKQEIDSPDGYWIGDLIGEVYDFGDTYTFDFRDILNDIKENAPKGEIFKWRDYVLRIWNINHMVNANVLNDVNYYSWVKGCPRISDEALDEKEEKYKKFIEELTELSKETISKINV